MLTNQILLRKNQMSNFSMRFGVSRHVHNHEESEGHPNKDTIVAMATMY